LPESTMTGQKSDPIHPFFIPGRGSPLLLHLILYSLT
jgi:hypothetical protein